MGNRKGIDLLRYAVKLFESNNESINQRFSAEELLRIADCMQKCEWDIWPDQWTERQLQECIQFGIVPQWELVGGIPTPKYRTNSDKIYEVQITYTAAATVQVYGDSIEDVTDWAEGDMPTPKNSEYVDDTFQLDEVKRVA